MAAILLLAHLLHAGEPATDSSLTEVALPPMIIDAADGPPWLYAEGSGCEFLSRCSKATTATVAESFGRARTMLDLILPPLVRGDMQMPEMMLLYDKALWRRAGTDVIAASLVRDQGAGSMRMVFPPNLRLADADVWATFALLEHREVDAQGAVLTPQAVAQVLAARVPRLPDWFSAGLLAVYPQLEQETHAVTLPPTRWTRAIEEEFAGKAREGSLPIPLATMLRSGRVPSDVSMDTWLAQAELLVRWGLEIESKGRGRFWRFVNDAAEAGDPDRSASIFLGLSLPEAERAASVFVLRARRGRTLVASLRASDVPKMRIREATAGEVARIRGEWERLVWRHVVRTAAAFAPSYETRARTTLRGAYDNGDRDPRLLASLGLLDLECGDVGNAREFLEAAVEAKVARPRPYFELAKLRYDDRWNLSKRNDGKFDAEAVAAILEPLLAARQMQPRVVEMYRMIGEVWIHAAEPATYTDLTVLEEGLRLFPRDGDLALKVAQVFEAAGQSRRAREIAERGARESAGMAPERLGLEAEVPRGE